MSTKPPSWNQIRTNARSFAAEWKDATSEQSDAQTFMAGFLAIFGVERKRVAVFEQHAKRTSTAGDGRIDMYWPGTLVWEHKSVGKDLAEAERQALDYLDDLEADSVPQVVITSDFKNLRMLDLGAANPEAFTIALKDLPKHITKFGFIAGYAKRDFAPTTFEVEANVKAAALLGRLYEQLANDNYSDHNASILLTRLLFLLFGDDTGMWDRSLFTELVQTRTSKDGSDLGAQLSSLFTVLDTPLGRRANSTDDLFKAFPYVNGGLFEDRIDVPFFGQKGRDELLACCEFDWSRLSPAIFGSLFQSVKDKESRRALGEHYTSETNILKLIRPLFLDELWDRFDNGKSSQQTLTTLRNDISSMTFVDPACGCGNFLVVTYRELRRLDLEIEKRLRALTGNAQTSIDVTLDLAVSLRQFHGIELEEWPARIAEVAMFLVDQQMNIELALEFGEAPDRLPINRDASAKIHNTDALRADWKLLFGEPSSSTLIFGNPPFNGARTLTSEGRRAMEDVWGKGLNGNFDFVTAWYKKSLDYFGMHVKGRWGFVSTNSICQGEPVADLWQPILDAGWRCRFAHRSFQWDSEAPGKAAVHVSIIGFDKQKASPKPRLWTYPENAKGESTVHEVVRINPYLIDGPEVLVRKRSSPMNGEMPKVSFGSMANDGGFLMVGPAEKPEFDRDPGASRFVQRFVGAKELVNNLDRWCLWLLHATGDDISASPLLRSRVTSVREQRLGSERKTTKELAQTPHLFGEIRQPNTNYLAIPRHVGVERQYFPCATFTPDVICGDANFLASDPDGFLFGVLASSMFISWMKAVGGRIKSDIRFSGTFTYNTFPMPEVSQPTQTAIVEAGAKVLEARHAHPNQSLANLYNPLAMPADLVKAHQALDRAVDKAFGTTARLETIDDRQKALFRSYGKLTGQELLG